MKKSLITTVSFLLLLLLTGCGGDHFQKEKIGHGYSVSAVPYKGGTVDCVVRSSGVSHGYTVRSISCDFVGFWRNRGNPAP